MPGVSPPPNYQQNSFMSNPFMQMMMQMGMMYVKNQFQEQAQMRETEQKLLLDGFTTSPPPVKPGEEMPTPAIPAGTLGKDSRAYYMNPMNVKMQDVEGMPGYKLMTYGQGLKTKAEIIKPQKEDIDESIFNKYGIAKMGNGYLKLPMENGKPVMKTGPDGKPIMPEYIPFEKELSPRDKAFEGLSEEDQRTALVGRTPQGRETFSGIQVAKEGNTLGLAPGTTYQQGSSGKLDIVNRPEKLSTEERAVQKYASDKNKERASKGLPPLTDTEAIMGFKKDVTDATQRPSGELTDNSVLQNIREVSSFDPKVTAQRWNRYLALRNQNISREEALNQVQLESGLKPPQVDAQGKPTYKYLWE